MKRTKIIGGVDRISELPECIIHRIMFHLPPEEVVRTCVLSKAWYNFKSSFPILDFNEKPFLEKRLANFTQLVHNSLLQFRRYNLPLHSFSVSLYKSSNFPDLDSWIRSALENGLEKLNLSSWSVDDYFLPQPVFLSKTLSILNVESCVLNEPLSLFSSLKKLFLRYCRIGCPIILEKGDCPLLEEFVCDDCEFDCVIRISDLLRLQIVDVMIGLVEEFVVSGQSIQSITIRDDSGPPTVINIDGCTHLKLLHLMSDNMTDTQFHRLLSKLPLLQELYLFHCYTLEEIKISNPKLKTLVVSLEWQTSLKILEIAAPSLKSFIFISDIFSPNCCEIKVVDCCCSLETLVLFKYFATEGAIQNLISKFPLLENLWIIRFMELEKMRVENLRLKRLHFVGCLNLKAVEVYSPNLFEFHCTGRESPKFSVADMKASGGLKFEDETSSIWLKRFKRMLINIVGIKDDDVLGMISVA